MTVSCFLYTLFLMMTPTESDSATRFMARELPYAYGALAPHVSEETMRYHHDKHYVGYVNKLNELLLDTPFEGQPLEDILLSADGALYNNAAQVWNHELFFEQLSPQPVRTPSPELQAAIDRDFGSLDNLKAQMNRAAAGLFGSGWVWLASDKEGRLSILSEPDAGNPLRKGLIPLLGLDVWEHAYYIDYRNRRADGVAALWNVIDWQCVSDRYAHR